MGNGRQLERASEIGMNAGSRSHRIWARLSLSLLVLLAAGSVLLGFGVRHRATHQTAPHLDAQHASAQSAASSIPTPSPVSFVSSSRPSRSSTPNAQAILSQLPLIFEPNQGQTDSRVKFLSQGAGYSLLLGATGAMLGMQTVHSSQFGQSQQFLRMKLVGANPAAVTTGTKLLPGKTNYLIGNNPKKWHTGVPQYAGVQYKSVYPGIDLVFYGNQGHLEYDFRVAPGADPAQAELQFDGAGKVRLSSTGDLILTGKEDGGLRLQAPQIYQSSGDRREPVKGRFVLRAANRVAFEIGPYDRSRELVIDPLLSFASYFGGTGSETFPSVAVNGDGNIYLAGTTNSTPTTFPLNGTVPTTIGTGTDIFVAKITPSQPPTVAYATFLGGTGTDTNVGLSVDNGGKAYIVGNTTSTDFPTSGFPYQSAPRTKGTQCASVTCTSVYVSVLPANGAAPLVYSSYLSGNGSDQASGMAIDANGDVFLTGTTTSNDAPASSPNPDDFPATYLPVPYQAAPQAAIQFFVTKVNTAIPGAGSIAYSSYFGGSSAPTVAVGGGIAVDATGDIYFSGTTNFYNSGSGLYGNSGASGDFPILNAYQPCLDTTPPVVLATANPCTAPATSPYPTDAFVAKINPLGQAGTQLLFSTYLGGAGADTGNALAIDSGAANIYLTGSTNSYGTTGFVIPTGSVSYQPCLNDPGVTITNCPTTNTASTDAFVAKFSNPTPSTTGTPSDVALDYFTYLGGGGNDVGLAITADTAGDAFVTGSTTSGTANPPAFPVTTGSIQTTLNGTQNAFYAQINTTTSTTTNGLGAYVTYFGGDAVDRGTSIALDPVSQDIFFAGDTTSTNVTTVDALQTSLSGPSDAFVVKLASSPFICIACVAPIISPVGVVPAGSPVSVTFTVSNQGPDVATGVTITGSVNSSGVTFVSGSAGSGSCSAATNNIVVCTIPTLQVGATSSVKFEVTPTTVGSFEAVATVVQINNTTTDVVATAPFTSADYSVSVSPSARTVAAGDIASYSVQLSPAGEFGANVALTCGSLPPSTTCTFSNSTVNLTNGNTSTTLNLATTPQPVNVISSAGWRHPLYAFWLMVPGMALLGVGAGKKSRRNRVLAWLALSVLFALVLLQPSCSHSNATPPATSGTPSGTYSLTVVATSGSFSRSAPLQLTVNP